MTLTIPTLETERLKLRPHRASDFDLYADFFASDRATHMGQLKRRHAWYSFTSDVAQWVLFGHGAWAIELKADQEFAGQIALLKPDHFPELELGWFVLSDYEHQGIAYEAAVAARQYAYSNLGTASLVSYIAPENTRSIALAERLGAQPDPDAARDDPADVVYRHPAPEAQA